MKKVLIFLWTALVGTLVSGCFEVTEEITLKKNGSGTYQMMVDLGDALSLINLMGQEGPDNLQMDQTLDQGMQEQIQNLSEIEGISNISSSREEGKILLSYAFDDIAALNEATANSNSLMQEFGNTNQDTGNYDWSKKLFSRTGVGDLIPQSGSDEFAQGLDMAKMFMKDAQMTTVYHLPRKVKNMTNTDAQLSDDKRTVTLEVSFLDLMEGKSDLGNEIRMR